MKPTSTLHDLGQSLWLDNINRDLLSTGTLQDLHQYACHNWADVESYHF